MFLTKKALWRIVAVAICCFLLGGGCIAVGIVFGILAIDPTPLFVLGVIACALCPLSALWGRYAEGKGKLINAGNRLVRNELKPLAFIEQYKEWKGSAELVVCKPDVETLNLLFIAYDSLNDREGCLATIDEMMSVAGEKKKTMAELIKVSFLFSQNMGEEAEALFTVLRNQRLDAVCNLLADSILKSDRAMVLGDYKTAEAYYLKLLAQTFPKLDPLGALIAHFKLGEVYEKMKEREQAISHYRYCVDHCGETAIGESARLALEKLQ